MQAEWRGAQAVLNPDFSGSGDVGGADADLIMDSCLWEIRCTERPRGQSDWLYELLSYVLLDYDDDYGFEHIGFLLPRQDKLMRWPVAELINKACVPSFLAVSQLRLTLRGKPTRLRNSTLNSTDCAAL